MNDSNDTVWGVFFGFLMGLLIMGMIIDAAKGYAADGKTAMEEQAVMMGHAHFEADAKNDVSFKWDDCSK